MRNLVYLSPVTWADFAQRPHKFVEWHHRLNGGRVLWLEPYPTRLPNMADLGRHRRSRRAPGQPVPTWLERVSVPALPGEPLPGCTVFNLWIWRRLLRRVTAFAAAHPSELVVGKPSRLALAVLEACEFARTSYDAMDDFPAFHRGWSARSIAVVEAALVRQVDRVQVSSSTLRAKFDALRAPTLMVRNAYDPEPLLAAQAGVGERDHHLIGYVGTIASWFDWNLVAALARAHSTKRFLLIGPLHTEVPSDLPANVQWQPACPHPEAMRHMARFGAGLIPFRHNGLTAAVDPVKYYEYRALGIPVLATGFGEMPQHATEDPGLFLLNDYASAPGVLACALANTDDADWLRDFRVRNTWEARFGSALSAR